MGKTIISYLLSRPMTAIMEKLINCHIMSPTQKKCLTRRLWKSEKKNLDFSKKNVGKRNSNGKKLFRLKMTSCRV